MRTDDRQHRQHARIHLIVLDRLRKGLLGLVPLLQQDEALGQSGLRSARVGGQLLRLADHAQRLANCTGLKGDLRRLSGQGGVMWGFL